MTDSATPPEREGTDLANEQRRPTPAAMPKTLRKPDVVTPPAPPREP